MPDLPEYTVAAVVAPLLVIALELLVLRTGLLRSNRYWITIAIVLAFQIPVDGWLTKPQGTVVHYQEAAIVGIRAPVSFPIEDFGFGFALVTLTLLLWRWYRQRAEPSPAGPRPGEPSSAPSRSADPAHPQADD